MRVAIAVLMMLEGLASAVRFARFVSILVIYPLQTTLLLVCRAGIGAWLFAGGAMVWRRAPAGIALAPAALLASAALSVLEIGFALAPSSLFPDYRWPAVALYVAYASLAAWWIRTRET